MNLSRMLAAAVLGSLVVLQAPAALAASTLKIAFLAPPGSKWDQTFKRISDEVSDKTSGEIRIRFIGGGVMGDEPDVVRKMRRGQLQGAALTGMGLGLIEPQVRVLELPMLYDSDADVDRVTAKVEDQLGARLGEKDHVLLGWAEVGPVYVFTNKPIRRLADFKGTRMWMWENDRLAEAIFKELGLQPTPLAITSVLTSLQTGMVDGVYNSPQGLVALQWNSKVRYALDFRLTQSVGALVVTRKAWDGLSADQQRVLREASRRHCETLVREGREDNRRALEALKRQGVQLTSLPAEDRKRVRQAADRVADELVGSLYPADLLRKVRQAAGR
jgi:TRAP-type C4-dicarboxylate transport system substrate-binding protein